MAVPQMKTVANDTVKPNEMVRPPSPARHGMTPKVRLPGSPFPNAVATIPMMPRMQMRPPGPAKVAVTPKPTMPGSPLPNAEHADD